MTMQAIDAEHALGRFAPNEAVAHREIEGQVVLMLPDQSDLFTLNGSGALVWGLLVEGRPLAEAAAQIAARYGIPLERARADVAALVSALLERDAVRPL